MHKINNVFCNNFFENDVLEELSMLKKWGCLSALESSFSQGGLAKREPNCIQPLDVK